MSPDKMMSRSYKACGVFTVVCALVVGTYAYMAQSGLLELLGSSAADSYYNLLVRGFAAGHLNLEKEVPHGLAQLPDPYDPAASAPYRLLPYRLHDLSYYRGKLYLYHGVTPALLLFWPVAALTGRFLLHREAVLIFSAIGFLASAGLLHALWRRYFVEVNAMLVASCALALGLATGVPVLLSQADVYQVPIACGYMLTMLALGAIWCALHNPEKRGKWLAAASLAYGLAVGARPTLLFGAVILLVPVVQARQERISVAVPLLSAIVPVTLIGLGLMLYNFLRFENPFEFGMRYQLSGVRQIGQQHFSLRYLWFNSRVYFLEPARWSDHFPFVKDAVCPPVPSGHSNVERPFGVLTNVPVVLAALAIPLIWKPQFKQSSSTLRWFIAAVILLFVSSALTLGLFCGANFRYETEFLPSLLLLAVTGILIVERAMANRSIYRQLFRCAFGVTLVLSIAFNLLASVVPHAQAHNILGFQLFQDGKLSQAINQYQQALRLDPDYVRAHRNLGLAESDLGRTQEAIEQFEQTLRLDSNDVKAEYGLAAVLERTGRTSDAIIHYRQALKLKPDLIEAQSALARLQPLQQDKTAR